MSASFQVTMVCQQPVASLTEWQMLPRTDVVAVCTKPASLPHYRNAKPGSWALNLAVTPVLSEGSHLTCGEM